MGLVFLVFASDASSATAADADEDAAAALAAAADTALLSLASVAPTAFAFAAAALPSAAADAAATFTFAFKFALRCWRTASLTASLAASLAAVFFTAFCLSAALAAAGLVPEDVDAGAAAGGFSTLVAEAVATTQLTFTWRVGDMAILAGLSFRRFLAGGDFGSGRGAISPAPSAVAIPAARLHMLNSGLNGVAVFQFTANVNLAKHAPCRLCTRKRASISIPVTFFLFEGGARGHFLSSEVLKQ